VAPKISNLSWKTLLSNAPEEFGAEDESLLAAYAQITIAIVLILTILLIKMITWRWLCWLSDSALHPDEVDEEIEDAIFIDCPLKKSDRCQNGSEKS
jgi:hypothetical protein